MKGLGKVHPPDAKVLEDIWLSFLPGAKIGVLGLNGAGKSSLLKIMAGEDTSFLGEAFPADGISDRVSCTRNRGSTRRRPCSATSRKASPTIEGAARRATTRSTRSSARTCRPRRWRRSSTSSRGSRTRSTRRNAWDLDSRLELAMDALRLPPPDADVTHAVGRRAPPRRAVPAAAAVARPAAARRADQPSRRRIGRLARALPQGLSGHGRRRHARPLFSRQRRRLDSRARSRPRHSVGRQLLVVARAEAGPPRAGGEAGDASASGRSSASSSGSACRRAPGRPKARRA